VLDPNYNDIVTGVNAPLNAILERTKFQVGSGRPTLEDPDYGANADAHLIGDLLD
jgi:hypothetical protein